MPTINHIGKNTEGRLIANEIRYDFQPRLCCLAVRLLPFVGILVLIAGIAVLVYIGIHPVL